MWKPDICLYHDDDDGFGAAWAVWRRWAGEVVYTAVNYGLPAPDVSGKHVLIVDFSYPRAVIDAMAQTAKSIVIIDHHKTAEEALAPFAVEMCGDAKLSANDVDGMLRDMAELDRPPVIAWFDMNHSGAVLAWMFCHSTLPLAMLDHIEDRDLWRFWMPNTREVIAALGSVPRDFDEWQRFSVELLSDWPRIVAKGYAILAAYGKTIDRLVGSHVFIDIGGHKVPAVNTHGVFASDVGDALLRMFPDAPFVATWSITPGLVAKFSLRSQDSRLDVSEIATQRGGGGHRNAAGFEIQCVSIEL